MTWAVEVAVFTAVGTQVHVVSAGEVYSLSCSRMSTSSQIFLRLENSIPSHRCTCNNMAYCISYTTQSKSYNDCTCIYIEEDHNVMILLAM